jgi:hypothetical protein
MDAFQCLTAYQKPMRMYLKQLKGEHYDSKKDINCSNLY